MHFARRHEVSEDIQRDALTAFEHAKTEEIEASAQAALEHFDAAYPLGISPFKHLKVVRGIVNVRKVGGGEVAVYINGDTVANTVADITREINPNYAPEVAAKVGFLLGLRFGRGEKE